MNDTPSKPALPPLSLGRTLKTAVRRAWESLGLVCAASLTLFAMAALTATIAARIGRISPLAGLIVGLTLGLGFLPPVWAGAFGLAHRAEALEGPSYAELWQGFTSAWGRAVALALAQLMITAVLAANLLFYLTRGSIAPLVLGVLFAYLLVFWGMNALYHWPLLAAGELGIIKRDDGGKPGLWAVLRNAFLLTASAPAFTFGMLVVIMAITIPLVITGVGAALLGGGLLAYLATQAARDQLVRFGTLPPPPDLETPAPEDRWRVS